MPFAIDPMEDKNKVQGGAPTNISGVSTGFNVPGQNAGASQKPGGPKSSGQFQNIQKYLSANQQQAAQMGEKIAGSVESKVGEATKQGEQLKSSIPGVQKYDPTQVLSKLPQATEEEKKTYQTMKQTGGYTGPSDVTQVSNYGGFQKSKTGAEEAVSQAQTEAGQRELFKQAYARPDYSQGSVNLDRALLGRSAEGKKAIQDIASKYQPIVGSLGQYQTQAEQAIQQAQNLSKENLAAFQPAEQKARTDILSPIEQRALQANQQAQKYNEYLQDISDLNLSPETMAVLGLSTGQRIFGTDLASYFQPQTAEASIQNIASREERQRYNDLMNFLGVNAGDLGMGDPTYKGPSFDTKKLASDIAAQNAAFEEFAKGRTYGGSFGYKGQDSVSDLDRIGGNYGNWEDIGSINLNLADYLSGKGEGAFTYGSSSRTGEGNYYDVLNSQKQAILAQIQADLEAQKANRIIQGPKDLQQITTTTGGKLAGMLPTSGTPTGIYT